MQVSPGSHSAGTHWHQGPAHDLAEQRIGSIAEPALAIHQGVRSEPEHGHRFSLSRAEQHRRYSNALVSLGVSAWSAPICRRSVRQSVGFRRPQLRRCRIAR